MNNNPDYIIIGASVLDALALPVAPNVFETGSVAADHIAMHTGGDALNEATVLASLGESVRLVSKIGADYAGNYIDAHCQHLKMDTTFLRREASLETSVNLVLVDDLGERHFVTSPNCCLRKLYPSDIPDTAFFGARSLCFASICVFHAFVDDALAQLFSEIADAFLQCGVRCVVLKTGAGGCFIKTAWERYCVPAFPHARCLDTTGAGDTFTACFLDALNHGMTLPECGKFANAGASICIEQIGATCGIENREQVMKRYQMFS